MIVFSNAETESGAVHCDDNNRARAPMINTFTSMRIKTREQMTYTTSRLVMNIVMQDEMEKINPVYEH